MDLKFVKFLGDGASADVYLGEWKQENKSKMVAVKVLKKKISKQMFEDFKKELKVMKKVHGDLVVKFYGITIRPRFTVILQFCERGSLHLQLNKLDWDCTWDMFFNLSSQCIQSVMALHTHDDKIVHRDLKSMNFLLTEDWTIKICDFGLSRQTTTGGSGSFINTLTTLKSCRGTYCYTAPELVDKEQIYTQKADVFSLSIILWEILFRTLTGTYKRPYSSYPELRMDFQVLIAVTNKQLRPVLPDNVPVQLKTLLQGAWAQDPADRKDIRFCFRLLNFAKSAYRGSKAEWDALRVTSS